MPLWKSCMLYIDQVVVDKYICFPLVLHSNASVHIFTAAKQRPLHRCSFPQGLATQQIFRPHLHLDMRIAGICAHVILALHVGEWPAAEVAVHGGWILPGARLNAAFDSHHAGRVAVLPIVCHTWGLLTAIHGHHQCDACRWGGCMARRRCCQS